MVRQNLLLRFVALNQGIGTVIVDGLEVLRFHHIRIDQCFGVHRSSHVAHDVLDEFWIVVGALGDVLFIGTLLRNGLTLIIQTWRRRRPC